MWSPSYNYMHSSTQSVTSFVPHTLSVDPHATKHSFIPVTLMQPSTHLSQSPSCNQALIYPSHPHATKHLYLSQSPSCYQALIYPSHPHATKHSFIPVTLMQPSTHSSQSPSCNQALILIPVTLMLPSTHLSQSPSCNQALIYPSHPHATKHSFIPVTLMQPSTHLSQSPSPCNSSLDHRIVGGLIFYRRWIVTCCHYSNGFRSHH
jgi:hypothetical protein